MVDRDTVDYRDTSSFDDSSLQDVQTIKSAILHKQYGKDVRSALAQLPDSLIKLFGDTGENSNTEVEEARGGFETLGLHEQAQNSSIDKVTVEVQDARTNSSSQTYPTLKERMDNQENDLNNSINDKLSQISAVPETFANLAALQSKYPTGKTGLFVTADTGHKYIWANGSWKDAGVYQGIAITDDQMLLLSQNTFNQGNLIGNGYFSTKDGAFAWGNATISLTDMLGKKLITAYSSNVEQFNGIGFNFSPSAMASWTDKSSSIFFAEFDIISGYDCNLTVDIGYKDDSTTVTDTLTTLILSKNSATHQKLMLVKNPYKNAKEINLLISDYNAEPINFSISNLKITRSSYLL